MYGIYCRRPNGCSRASCIYPDICKDLELSQQPSLKLLKEIRELPRVKKLFIGSGVRYDLAMLDKEYMEEMIKHHVSGQLSVAPEHICDEVLCLMKKPSFDKYLQFHDKFKMLSKKNGKKQFLVPYFIASHPGAKLKHALELAIFLKKKHIRVEQVQNFTPTPMTISTCMYYTGLDPFTGKKVYVAKGEERRFQKALLQPHLKSNFREVVKVLHKIKRLDLKIYLTRP